jgi:GTP diphosphokinase / guanosine-3',5'-bis(diphosphate) 3'-diphosphatase
VGRVCDKSRRPGEDYLDYVRRAGRQPLSRKLKLADLADNMAWRRRKGRAAKDQARLARYRRAYRMLSRIAASAS